MMNDTKHAASESPHSLPSSEHAAGDIRGVLTKQTQAHPALARLRRRLADVPVGDDAITAYSRMHHRHNRT